MNQNFEDMKISDLKKLYEQYKAQNPEIKTAQELLEEKIEGGNVEVPEEEFDYTHR